MYVRLSRLAGLSPERIDELIGDLEQGDYVSEIEGAAGFRGFMVGVDWEGGKATVISLWDSIEELRASDAVADEARAVRVQKAQPERAPIVDRYEVVLERQLSAS